MSCYRVFPKLRWYAECLSYVRVAMLISLAATMVVICYGANSFGAEYSLLSIFWVVWACCWHHVEKNPLIVVSTLTAIFGVLTFKRSIDTRRMDVLREILKTITTDPEISGAYWNLVYGYSNPLYGEVKKLLESVKGTRRLDLERLARIEQFKASKGLRFTPYTHNCMSLLPDVEKQIDALLAQLEFLRYQYELGHVGMRDIDIVFGEQLQTMNFRLCVLDYINATVDGDEERMSLRRDQESSFTDAEKKLVRIYKRQAGPFTLVSDLLREHSEFCAWHGQVRESCLISLFLKTHSRQR